jgi:hypothetical protein
VRISDGRLAVDTESFACGCGRTSDGPVGDICRAFGVIDRRSALVNVVRALLLRDRAGATGSERRGVFTALLVASFELDTAAGVCRAGGCGFDGSALGGAADSLLFGAGGLALGEIVIFTDRIGLEDSFFPVGRVLV